MSDQEAAVIQLPDASVQVEFHGVVAPVVDETPLAELLPSDGSELVVERPRPEHKPRQRAPSLTYTRSLSEGTHRWAYPLGVELCRSGRKKGQTRKTSLSQLVTQVRREMAKRKIKGFSDQRPYEDVACVEVPSPIFVTVESAEKWCGQMFEVFDHLGLEWEDGVNATGGGHIHVKPDNHIHGQMKVDMAYRPYLLWAFQTHNQGFCRYLNSDLDHKSEVANRARKIKKFRKEWAKVPKEFLNIDYRKAEELFLTGRGQVLLREMERLNNDCLSFNYGYSTCEFRLLDSAQNLDEQMLHFQFVDHYVRWCAKTYDRRPLPLPLHDVASRYNTLDKAAGAFFDFIEQIGLKPEKYEVFASRNMPGWMTRYNRAWN